MITLAICDVDMMARKSIRLFCESYFENKNLEYQILQYSAGEDLLAENCPDILLMDVKLKRINGIFVKEILEKLHADTRILFISENRNYMSEAFGKNVYGYLIKPMKEAQFRRKMDEMLEDIQAQSQCVFLKREYGFYKVWLKDVLYIEVSGRGTHVFINGNSNQTQTFVTDIPLVRWEEILLGKGFYRANRRQIINYKYVIDIKDEIELVNQIKIPIGTIYKENLIEKYDECRSGYKGIYRNASRTSGGAGKIYR